MARCLTEPSHYLSQCWLNLSRVLHHSPWGKHRKRSWKLLLKPFKNYTLTQTHIYILVTPSCARELCQQPRLMFPYLECRWYSGNFTEIVQDINLWNGFENNTFKIAATSLEGPWVNTILVQRPLNFQGASPSESSSVVIEGGDYICIVTSCKEDPVVNQDIEAETK